MVRPLFSRLIITFAFTSLCIFAVAQPDEPPVPDAGDVPIPYVWLLVVGCIYGVKKVTEKRKK
jgi:hypothetical protein